MYILPPALPPQLFDAFGPGSLLVCGAVLTVASCGLYAALCYTAQAILRHSGGWAGPW